MKYIYIDNQYSNIPRIVLHSMSIFGAKSISPNHIQTGQIHVHTEMQKVVAVLISAVSMADMSGPVSRPGKDKAQSRSRPCLCLQRGVDAAKRAEVSKR
jgi:hypothetical protein